jgi:hypothetical protein
VLRIHNYNHRSQSHEPPDSNKAAQTDIHEPTRKKRECRDESNDAADSRLQSPEPIVRTTKGDKAADQYAWETHINNFFIFLFVKNRKYP